MTAFHEQAWAQRFGVLGDTAEAVFDIVHPKSHKLGLNRPPFGMGGMNPVMRYTPDRMIRSAAVEVMGIGRDGVLKLKHEKLDALKSWAKIMSVDLFVYHQTSEVYYQAPLSKWGRALTQHGIDSSFDDGKTYIALSAEHFPCEPAEVGDAEP